MQPLRDFGLAVHHKTRIGRSRQRGVDLVDLAAILRIHFEISPAASGAHAIKIRKLPQVDHRLDVCHAVIGHHEDIDFHFGLLDFVEQIAQRTIQLQHRGARLFAVRTVVMPGVIDIGKIKRHEVRTLGFRQL